LINIMLCANTNMSVHARMKLGGADTATDGLRGLAYLEIHPMPTPKRSHRYVPLSHSGQRDGQDANSFAPQIRVLIAQTIGERFVKRWRGSQPGVGKRAAVAHGVHLTIIASPTRHAKGPSRQRPAHRDFVIQWVL